MDINKINRNSISKCVIFEEVGLDIFYRAEIDFEKRKILVHVFYSLMIVENTEKWLENETDGKGY